MSNRVTISDTNRHQKMSLGSLSSVCFFSVLKIYVTYSGARLCLHSGLVPILKRFYSKLIFFFRGGGL